MGVPFLKARVAGLERLAKDGLVRWSELGDYHWKHRIRRWIGLEYLKTRHSEFHKDLYGYVILPGLVVITVALLLAPLWI